MAKRPKPGKCVHCLSDPVERTWDHVFPRSWYPDTSEPNVYKWQIPSCLPCNKALGKIEEDFLRRIGLCLDPNDDASRSIVEKALRSMRPSAAKNERDRKFREGLRERMLREALEGEAIPTEGVFPGLGERWGRPAEERVAFLIPEESFSQLTEKIVRGIFYVEDRKFVEPPYKVNFFALHEGGQIRQTIDRLGQEYAREPGVVVRRYITPEDGLSALFEIEFWRQFKTYASVLAE